VQRAARSRLEQQLAAVAPGAQRHRGRHRPGDLQRLGIRQQGARARQERIDMRSLVRLRAQQRLVRIRRQPRFPALVQQLARGGGVTVGEQAAQQRVVGMVGLQQHVARPGRAAGAAGHLHHHLRQPLAGAEVHAEQAFVHAHDGDQGEMGQVVALGQHLRADQDRRFGVVAQAVQQLLEAVAAAGGLAVDAQHGHAGEVRDQGFLQPFGALALWLQLGAAAGGAGGGHRGAVVAVVADQHAAAGVQGHRAFAARAVGVPAAGVAQQHRRVAAAVAEHQRLLAARHGVGHRRQQRGRQAVF
jgi:hypothetical protein